MLIKNRARKINTKHQNQLHCQHYFKLIKKTKEWKIISKNKNQLYKPGLSRNKNSKQKSNSMWNLKSKTNLIQLHSKTYAINTLSTLLEIDSKTKNQNSDEIHTIVAIFLVKLHSNLDEISPWNLHWNLRRKLRRNLPCEFGFQNLSVKSTILYSNKFML